MASVYNIAKFDASKVYVKNEIVFRSPYKTILEKVEFLDNLIWKKILFKIKKI